MVADGRPDELIRSIRLPVCLRIFEFHFPAPRPQWAVYGKCGRSPKQVRFYSRRARFLKVSGDVRRAGRQMGTLRVFVKSGGEAQAFDAAFDRFLTRHSREQAAGAASMLKTVPGQDTELKIITLWSDEAISSFMQSWRVSRPAPKVGWTVIAEAGLRP